jgi:HEAT repeat protein
MNAPPLGGKDMNQPNVEALDPQQLVERLGDADWNVRQAASSALFARGKAALEALIKGLSHTDWQVRAACAGLMDHLADDRCVDPLRRALLDPSPHVRRHAVHSLGCQECKSAPLQVDIAGLLIERALTDASIRVRRVAVHQLGLQTYDPRAVKALQTLLHQEMDAKLLSRARFALKSQQEQQTSSG